jgi:hypothetical protein
MFALVFFASSTMTIHPKYDWAIELINYDSVYSPERIQNLKDWLFELTIRKLSQMLAIALYFHVDVGSGMANAPVIKHL